MLQPFLTTVDQLKEKREKLLLACHQALFAETPDFRQLAVNTAHGLRDEMQATVTSLSTTASLVSDFMRSPAPPAGDDSLLASVEGLIKLTERKSSKMGLGSTAYPYGGGQAYTAMPAPPANREVSL